MLITLIDVNISSKKLAGNQVSIAVGKQIPLIKLSESYHSALIALRNIQDHQYINYDVLTLEIILQSISIYDKKRLSK